MSEWISVNDDMPLEKEFVLFCNHKEVFYGWYDSSQSKYKWSFFDEATQVEVFPNGLPDTHVTHWQYLPQPPND